MSPGTALGGEEDDYEDSGIGEEDRGNVSEDRLLDLDEEGGYLVRSGWMV